MMTRWWNRMPQFDGLFDFQDNVRPSYFAFKLLARLQGERLRLTSSDEAVHGFLAADEKLRMSNLLVWNFSTSPAEVDLTLEKMPKDMRVRHVVLDAHAPSRDGTAGRAPAPPARWKKGDVHLRVRPDPYAIHYWSLE